MSTALRARRLLRRALSRRAEAPEGSGELNIVPFLDIVTNLMLFLLATITMVATVSEVRAELPSFGPGHREGLGLSVTLTSQGAIMRSATGRIGAGCVSGAQDPVAARVGEGYDLEALGRCAARLHAAMPDEHDVTLSADPEVPYGALVQAMDALRTDGAQLFFPDVHLSAGVR